MPSGRGLSILLILFLAALAPAAPALALVHYVDAARPNDSGDGLSWATAKKTIQGAINATTAAHQVWVKKGTYAEAIQLRSGAALYGGFSGSETRLDQRAGKAQDTILDGGPVAAQHVVTLDGVTNTLMDGFTITGGLTTSDAGVEVDGGGGMLFRNANATNRVENCLIHGNAAHCGGGIFMRESSPLIRRCMIFNNRAEEGGGIYCASRSINDPQYTPAMSTTNPEFTSCTLANNIVASGSGGGMYLWQANAVLKACTLSGNKAGSGGGASFFSSGSSLVNCVISGNASGGQGGAFTLSHDASQFINCTIDANEASQGGALWSVNESKTLLRNTILAHHAGIAILPSYETDLVTLRHCLFHANSAADLLLGTGAVVSGANAINLKLAGAAGNVSGDPLFVAGPAGTLNGLPQYDAASCSSLLPVKGGGLAPGAFKGRLLQISLAQSATQMLVLDNTATAIRVLGDATEWVTDYASWQVMDYHLRNGSAALDRGAGDSAAPGDFEGDVRPGADGLYDIGADEAPAAYAAAPDSAAPVSSVAALPDEVTSATFNIQALASDAESGVAAVRLYYRRNGGAWTLYPDAATSISATSFWTVSFNSALAGGDGDYEFYSVARDRAGNQEAAPAGADAATLIKAHFFSPVVYVNSAATGKNNGESWTDACRTIAKGLAYAATFNIREVWVARGRYSETLTMPGNVSLYGGFAPGATQFSQRDTQPYMTVIDASKANGGEPALHVIAMNAIANARVDGFTLTGGVANYSRMDGYDPGDDSGGGVFCAGATACEIANCTITGNSAYAYGGGIGAYHSDVSIRDCMVFENTAFGGGGVSFQEGASQLRGSRICGNRSTYCAGVYVDLLYQNSALTIEDCAISANGSNPYSDSEGVAGLFIASVMAPVQVRNCIISGNAAGYGVGGIAFYSSSLVQIVNCTIADNTSRGSFGAVHVYPVSTTLQAVPLLKNLILAGNSLNALTGTTEGLTLTDCLQSADSRTSYTLAGSPRFLMGPGGTLTGDAVLVGPYRYVLTDSQARWKPGALIGKLVIPDLRARGQALVVDNTSTTLVVAGAGQALAGAKYQFVDYHLGRGSAAIDAGDMTGAPALDMERNPRPVDIPGVGGESSGKTVDLGAYEAMASTPPRIRVTPALDPVNFGAVDIIDGPTPPRAVAIYNLGFRRLTFSSPALRLAGRDAADFTTTVTAGALTGLDPGTSCTVAVAFDPVTTGTKTAALLIASDDPDAPLTTVSLTGQGIIPKTTITRMPTPQLADPDSSATFSIAATGRAPLTYQWYRDNTPLADGPRISGAQTTTLTLSGLTRADEGYYQCRVASSAGSARSNSVRLTVKCRVWVISPYGLLNPPPGVYLRTRNSSFSITMTSATVNTAPGERLAFSGWTGQNTSPVSGASSANFSFIVTGDSTVTLHWTKQYALQAAVDPPDYGTVAPGSGWYAPGLLSLEARPCSSDSLFTGWSGALSGAMTSASLNLNGPTSVTAHFAARPGATGAVSINVRPPTVGWTLKDSANRVIEGAGPSCQTVAPGPLTLTWKTPPNHNAPAANPVLRVVPPGGEVSIMELFDPADDAKRRQGNAIVRYLLGLTSDPAGLDLNGDGRVSITDVVRGLK